MIYSARGILHLLKFCMRNGGEFEGTAFVRNNNEEMHHSIIIKIKNIKEIPNFDINTSGGWSVYSKPILDELKKYDIYDEVSFDVGYFNIELKGKYNP
ncbi:MAG: hypothetical protein LBR24_00570 [Methanobrevibacter sp.]|jgi:hypothetical protein|nr:hypothetical protein [Methanobrevibacter sp.]